VRENVELRTADTLAIDASLEVEGAAGFAGSGASALAIDVDRDGMRARELAVPPARVPRDGGGGVGAQGAFSATGGAAGAVAINPGIRSRRPHRILKFIAFGSTGVIAAPLPKSPAGRVERTARIEKTDINYA
jgi:hypothetical protein